MQGRLGAAGPTRCAPGEAQDRVKVRVRARARVRVRVRGLGVHHGLAVAEPQLCVGVAGPAAELVQVVG